MTNLNTPTHNTAANAYQTTGYTALSPIETVVALYRGIITNLDAAKISYQAKNLEEVCQLNEKTFRILAALQCHLDFEHGGDTAPALDKFYTALFIHLAKVLEAPDPAAEYTYLGQTTREVYDKWQILSNKME